MAWQVFILTASNYHHDMTGAPQDVLAVARNKVEAFKKVKRRDHGLDEGQNPGASRHLLHQGLTRSYQSLFRKLYSE